MSENENKFSENENKKEIFSGINVLTVGLVQEVSDMEHFKDIVSNKMSVVDFTAKWCSPCKRIKPYFIKLASEYPNAIFCSVDVDDCESVSTTCQISAMPTFQIWSEGKLIEKMTGANEESLLKLITKYYK